MAAEQLDKIKMLTDQISPILHGHNPEIQGAVLADPRAIRVVLAIGRQLLSDEGTEVGAGPARAR